MLRTLAIHVTSQIATRFRLWRQEVSYPVILHVQSMVKPNGPRESSDKSYLNFSPRNKICLCNEFLMYSKLYTVVETCRQFHVFSSGVQSILLCRPGVWKIKPLFVCWIYNPHVLYIRFWDRLFCISSASRLSHSVAMSEWISRFQGNYIVVVTFYIIKIILLTATSIVNFWDISPPTNDCRV
jgi:hypothetical protein